jgi:ribosomal-protein-alanine N-acetyltransferase
MPAPVSSAAAPRPPVLSLDAAARVRFERPGARREREFVTAALRSRALHLGLVTAPATVAEYRDYLRRTHGSDRESFFVVTVDSDELAGVVDINDIVRSAQPSARLGYYAFVPFAGRGLMREGVALVVNRAFGALGLQRLEANVQPHNARSIALLEQLGFRRVGTARGFLKIGTRWRDHERWALHARDWRAR